MNRTELEHFVSYSKNRGKKEELSKTSYITTDNILPNKAGVTNATNLPPNGTSFPKYEVGDILISNIRPYLKKIWYADKEGLCSSDVLVLKSKAGNDSKFIYYCLHHDYFFEHMMKGSKGTKMPRGDKSQILRYKIPNFRLATQLKISSILSSLDEKIEINRKINSELESMAKTIYDYWFVQFDFPDENGQPYKSSGGNMVYNEVLKREIPEGWEVKKLTFFCDKIGDGIHGTPQYVDSSDYSFINGNNLKDGFLKIESGTKKVSCREFDKYHIEFNDDTIFLSLNGTIGNLATYLGEKVILGKSAAYINCKKPNRPYCYQYLNSEQVQKQLWNIATGSTIKNLSLGSLSALAVPFPGDILIRKYSEINFSIHSRKQTIFKENKELSNLRDWLLPMLMNGQVTVKDAYEQVERVLSMAAEG